MTSNKFTSRRGIAKKPPICISKPPKPPYPPYPGGRRSTRRPMDPAADWARRSRLPPVPSPPYRTITVWNLAYHIFPHPGNEAWLRNLDQLRQRWQQFNGRRLVAIATGPDLVPPADVVSFLGRDAEYFPIPNDPRLRETATFLNLLRTIRTTATNEATFYAHTKGASQHHYAQPGKELAIRYWRNRMYKQLLDNPITVANTLRSHATCGTFKIDYSEFPDQVMESPTGLDWGTWHYAGNFLWFRHDCIFRNPHWSEIADDPYACEMWLGNLIDTRQGGSIYQPWPAIDHPPPDLYDPSSHLDPIP